MSDLVETWKQRCILRDKQIAILSSELADTKQEVAQERERGRVLVGLLGKAYPTLRTFGLSGGWMDDIGDILREARQQEAQQSQPTQSAGSGEGDGE